MKQILLFLICQFSILSLFAQQTYRQPIPKKVTEIHYSPSTTVTTEKGSESALIVERDTLVATVKRNVMTIHPTVNKVTIVVNSNSKPISIICDALVHNATRGTLIADQADTASTPKQKRPFWHWRNIELHFAWGFHNWGDDMFNGFEGVDGDASIRTSFNNIQLSVNYPIVGTRHTGLYLGLGLEWDKYKFEASEISFNTATAP